MTSFEKNSNTPLKRGTAVIWRNAQGHANGSAFVFAVVKSASDDAAVIEIFEPDVDALIVSVPSAELRLL